MSISNKRKIASLTHDERRRMTSMVLSLFDHWKLADTQQATLLDLPKGQRGLLTRYRKGAAIGTYQDRIDRVAHLLVIHKRLRTLFPQSRELAYRWMTSRNRAFSDRTPVDMIDEHGFAGLLAVRGYLERAVNT
jgi:hypothetical protein